MARVMYNYYNNTVFIAYIFFQGITIYICKTTIGPILLFRFIKQLPTNVS